MIFQSMKYQALFSSKDTCNSKKKCRLLKLCWLFEGFTLEQCFRYRFERALSYWNVARRLWQECHAKKDVATINP